MRTGRTARTGWIGFWVAALTLVAATTALACTDQAVIGTPGVGPNGEPGLQPQSGPPGTVVLIEGRKFYDRMVEIRWHSAQGPLLTTTHGPEFATEITAPDRAAGAYTIVALVRDDNGNVDAVARAPFRLTADRGAQADDEPDAPPDAGSDTADAGDTADGGSDAPEADQQAPPPTAPTDGAGSAARERVASEPAATSDGEMLTAGAGLLGGGMVLLLGVAGALVVRHQRRTDAGPGG